MPINCLIIDDEEMSRNIIRQYIEQTESFNLIDSFANPIDAIQTINKAKIDLLFLDIEMPEMSGLELLKSLSKPPQIIFTSGKRDYAAEAFDYDVTDYLVKPITYSRFLKAISKAKDSFKEQNFGTDLYVRTESKIVKLSFNEINYVEALADYIMIFTANHEYIVHSTMKGFQSKLPSEKFLRIHRSYIVNKEKIESIENLFVVIKGKFIPIGASYKDDFMDKINLL